MCTSLAAYAGLDVACQARPRTASNSKPRQAVGQPAKIGSVGRLTVRIGGLFSPRTRELNETLYQWERPFLVDDSKWQRAFGPYQPVPLAEAVERTLAWFKSRQLPR